MGDDQAAVFHVFADDAGGFGGDEAEAGAVETVAAEGVFFIQGARYGVGVGVFRHGLVEGGVEHGNVGQAGKNGLCGADAGQVGRIVQRGERDAGFQLGDDFVVNQDGRAVFFAAVHDAVADGFHIGIQAVFFQFVQKCADCAGVVVAVGQFHAVFLTVFFESDVGIGGGQFFTQAAQQHFAVVVVEHCAFQRRTAAVQY